MHTTSATLLGQLRGPDRAAWERFVALYTPLLFDWARHLGLQPSDAADLVQDVMATLVRRLPWFEYDRERSFRAWLKAVTVNQWKRNRQRLPVTVGGDEPAASGPDPFEEAEYARYLVRHGLDRVRHEFCDTVWRAFARHVLDDVPAAAVAAELGVKLGTVYAAKSRVFQRLREELAGLID